MERILIIGCGEMGRRVASLWKGKGAAVVGAARSDAKLAEAKALGIETVRADLDDPDSLTGLPLKSAVVFYMAPPPGGGIYDTRMRNLCASINAENKPRRVIYLSTSGVYGDCGDTVVTEETPVNPQTARAKRRLDAEAALSAAGTQLGFDVIILRVTGIYGPGRLPVSQLAAGHPMLEDRLCPPTNRIHAADLAEVCLAAAEKGDDGDIFNVSDGRTGTIAEYFDAAADLLGYPRPRRVSPEEAQQVMTPLMLSYLSESRRMDNGKMMKKLGIKLLYPTLEEGIKACLS